jgi:hypothetical protein
VIRSLSAVLLALLLFGGMLVPQTKSSLATPAKVPDSKPQASETIFTLRASSTMNLQSEMGGAFSSAKCDADGNLYIRKFDVDRPLLGPVAKIDPDGKRITLFDPAAFQLALNRADAFSPASDGGLYRIAQSGVSNPQIYVLHFGSDGAPSSSTRLDADFEVYTFAAFADGNSLVSGLKRDVSNKNDRRRNFTAVFSADGRELAQLSFTPPSETAKGSATSHAKGAQELASKDADKTVPMLDLADAESGSDGYLYVMRASSPAVVSVIDSSGKIMQMLKVAAPAAGAVPSAFHVSGNRLAISFWNEQSQSQTVVVADAQTGERIATYADPEGLGNLFACYSANDGVFTFLKLGEGNELELIRAEAQ